MPTASSPKKTSKPGSAAKASEPGALDALDCAALYVVARKAEGEIKNAPKGLQQEIDVTLRIHGRLDVNENSTTIVAKKPDLFMLLAHLIELRPKNKRQSLANEIQLRYAAAAPISEETKKLAEQVLATLTVNSPQARRGAVTGLLAVERVR
jgi:hypothetical protein